MNSLDLLLERIDDLLAGSDPVIVAIPGIILQLILLPAIMLALDRTHLVPFRKQAPARE